MDSPYDRKKTNIKNSRQPSLTSFLSRGGAMKIEKDFLDKD